MDATDVTVLEAMRGRLDDLAVLIGTAEGKGEGWADPDKLEALGIKDKHATEDDGQAAEEASDRLDEYHACVDTKATFEIVISGGGPSDAFLIQCNVFGGKYEIRSVLYRHSYGMRELIGEDRETAEAFARRVVPELSE